MRNYNHSVNYVKFLLNVGGVYEHTVSETINKIYLLNIYCNSKEADIENHIFKA